MKTCSPSSAYRRLNPNFAAIAATPLTASVRSLNVHFTIGIKSALRYDEGGTGGSIERLVRERAER